jgi:hypothetical protein
MAQVNDMIKNLGTFGVSSLMSLTPIQKATFVNIDTTINSAIMFVFLIMMIVYILLLMATYKLTGSGLQTVLCLLFGSTYLIFAFIIYGFSGYKLKK